MLYEILFAAFILGSGFGSTYIAENALRKQIIDLGYKGLKLNQNELDKDNIDLDTDYYSLNGPLKNHKLLGQLLVYLPGINILVALGVKHKMNKKFKEVLGNEKYLAPLVEEEKHELLNASKNKDKYKILKYASKMRYEEALQKYYPDIEEKRKDYERRSHTLHRDRIINHEFTPEEIKRINAVNNEGFKDLLGLANWEYRLGRVNNENIAVIGVPLGAENDLKEVYIDESEDKYPFEWYGDSYAKAYNMKFKVYPYIFTNSDCVRAEVDQIIREQASKDEASRIEITREIEEPIKDKDNVPTKKKTL
jgi:hypothetical protein